MKKLLAALAALLLAIAAYAAPSAYNNAALTATPVLVEAVPSTTLASVNAYNANASPVYLQFFNAATAGAVTLGTTPPTFWLAVGATLPINRDFFAAYQFPLGMVVAVTTTPTGNTAPGTAVPISLLYQ